MKKNISLNYSNISNFVDDKSLSGFYGKAEKKLKLLESGQGKGKDFLGWLDLPYSDEYKEIMKFAQDFTNDLEAVVLIGIGGSYLGTKAILSSLQSTFGQNKPQILFAGHNLDESYHDELLKYLENKEYGIVVISKSGTTTEPAIAFRLLRKHLEKSKGHAVASKRIVAITDKHKGALKYLAEQKNYKTFVIPDNVGGRFSVLSPVGLVPLAIAGVDISQLLAGAKDMDKRSTSANGFGNNPVVQYAAVRNSLYNTGKKIELLVSYNPKMLYFIEWWKQLYGESEGKEHKGIFPAGVINTTDLHSLGQYIQDGERILFESVLAIENTDIHLPVPSDEDNLDNLNYLAGKNLFDINRKAMEATSMAHISGGVPNIEINIPRLNEYYLGQLLFFFEKACAVSGYILGVNPFDQPGVEAYKTNMFKLLQKPGY